MKIPTAAESYIQASKIVDEEFDVEDLLDIPDEIVKAIQRAASKGEKEVIVQTSLLEYSTEDALRLWGYTCEVVRTHMNEYGTSISWEL